MNKTIISGSLALGMIIAAGAALAGPPVQNIGRRHPNLEAAQRLCAQAYAKITASQEANEFDEGGHAAKAKQLLDQVNEELKQAAVFDNHKK